MIECGECGVRFEIQTDSYRCPMCGTSNYPPDETVVTTEAQAELRKMLEEMKDRRCPQCQSPMMHTRLAGYRCPRGCQ